MLHASRYNVYIDHIACISECNQTHDHVSATILFEKAELSLAHLFYHKINIFNLLRIIYIFLAFPILLYISLYFDNRNSIIPQSLNMRCYNMFSVY